MPIDTIKPLVGSLDNLLHTVTGGEKEYVQPALKNLGSVSIVLLREVISPASFRNADPEITDIDVAGDRRIRAIANKFKYGERSRGLQVLRYMNAGGRMPQNRTELTSSQPASAGFDMNSIVFGDSANRGKAVLPVKASFQYSDALSIQPYSRSVDATFHNRAAEDGTLFDAKDKKNSNNLFERHIVRPGTLFLQVISLNGRTAPFEALEHFLLCLGLAGSYGGQTSVYGVNVKNHIVGVYGGLFERSISSPYEAIELLTAGGSLPDTPSNTISALDALYSAAYPTRVPGADITSYQKSLIDRLENNPSEMAEVYRANAEKVAHFFDQWFGISSDSGSKKTSKKKETVDLFVDEEG